MKVKDIYAQRGVSSGKEDVHNAIKNLDKGIFPGAFCKILPDLLGKDPNYCNVMHADGSGTKSSLAYAYWRETGDLSVWKGIAQDALIMNLDDLLCIGVTKEPILYSSTIGRNKKLVPGEVISAIVEGTEELIQKFNSFGMNIVSTGGETADVGDLVRTIIVDGSAVARAERRNIIVPNIRPGGMIVGLSSFGKAIYEDIENSGMGSNGLTSARHDIFNKKVGERYPESFDPTLKAGVVYCGNHNLTDPSPIQGIDYGKFVLSPTRTYAPVFLELFRCIEKRNDIHAIIHCSGGAQTKVLNFIDKNVRIVKDDLFPTPPLFTEIQKATKNPWKLMYKTFNMGHRMEVYCCPTVASIIISIASKFKIDAKVIGYCESIGKYKHQLKIESDHGVFYY